jgi:hypothetical protein
MAGRYDWLAAAMLAPAGPVGTIAMTRSLREHTEQPDAWLPIFFNYTNGNYMVGMPCRAVPIRCAGAP